MSAGTFRVPTPKNERIDSFAPGSAERTSLQAELARQSDTVEQIPCIIGGEHVYTGNTVDVRMPCDHGHVLAKLHIAGPEHVQRAVDAAQDARDEWMNLHWSDRAAVFLKAATLLSGPWRDKVNAATMIGQGKTCYQADIDAAAELCDFWRFNAKYTADIWAEQPPVNSEGVWNRLDYRPLDGFVFAITPFNFTSIALNLPTAPAMVGNTTLWKPSTTSALACWHLAQLLEEAGLPGGVVNMINGPGRMVGEQVLARRELAGLHFTGSTRTFQSLWKGISNNIERYDQYPRIVGETGGKDFIAAHPSADATQVAVAILRGAFEYQGQKCSAASRVYVPKSLWPDVRDQVVEGLASMKMGDVRDFDNFVSAVISESAFEGHCEYLDLANSTGRVHAGGKADGSTGWYVQPTLVEVDDPGHRLMREEIFGPICTVFVYDDGDWEKTLEVLDATSPYALTGAVFARDRRAIAAASKALRFSAGNFYINDKPTGAVVGQQPFGGGRASGTNDKAGSPLNLTRWLNPRTIKETFNADRDWRYPFLG